MMPRSVVKFGGDPDGRNWLPYHERAVAPRILIDCIALAPKPAAIGRRQTVVVRLRTARGTAWVLVFGTAMGSGCE